jgi:hypothetical protein
MHIPAATPSSPEPHARAIRAVALQFELHGVRRSSLESETLGGEP